MKKTYNLQNLDSAHCAALMETGIRKISGVSDASVSFMTQKLTITVDDTRFDEIMQEVQKTCKKIEPDCIILE
ncbi:MAG: cation transporter [Methanocalculaceae archaeon]|jgi:copper chaperone CopZ|nr:cation transporter [Methanocalculaceae archaeon]